jgi:very-short-patch-repair endonuclease
LALEEVRVRGLEKKFYLNSEIYQGVLSLLNWSCMAEWHPFSMTFGNVSQGRGCPVCALKYNKWEDSVFDQLVLKFPYLKQRIRRLLETKSFQIDIWDPKNLKAVELDGDYWHSQPKQISRDLLKNQECLDANIQLLRVKYSEYMKDPELALAKIIQFLS